VKTASVGLFFERIFDRAGTTSDNEVVPHVLLRMSRPIAGGLMLAIAVVSSAECLTVAQKTPEQHACCAAMKSECEMAVTVSCCATEATASQGFTATKPMIAVAPVTVLAAVLSMPPVAALLSVHVVAGL